METKTETFRKQHRELLNDVNELLSMLNFKKNIETTKVIKKLFQISGKINVHLVMEDKALYPMLLNMSEKKVREIAKEYMDEMGNIASAFKNYKMQWNTRTKIETDINSFIKETRDIFNVLFKRIEKEDTILYPLVDKS